MFFSLLRFSFDFNGKLGKKMYDDNCIVKIPLETIKDAYFPYKSLF